jgi:hypothetical protein
VAVSDAIDDLPEIVECLCGVKTTLVDEVVEKFAAFDVFQNEITKKGKYEREFVGRQS